MGSGCQKAYHSVNDPFSTSNCLHIYRERYISPYSCFTPVVECCCMLLGSRYVVESGDHCSGPASVLCKSCIPGYNMWEFLSVSSFPYGSDTLSIFSWIGARFSHFATIGEDLALISLWILIPGYIKSCIWSRDIEGLFLALGIKGIAGPLGNLLFLLHWERELKRNFCTFIPFSKSDSQNNTELLNRGFH